MSLADLTAQSVRQAVAEYDRLGQHAFLSTYGFGKARGYVLIHNGQPYDSKAIAGVAHQYLPGRVALKAEEFSGGENAAAGRLRDLGFDTKRSARTTGQRPNLRAGWNLQSCARHSRRVFLLRPAVSGEEPEIEKAATQLRGRTLAELRRRAIEDANDQPTRKEGRRSYIERSASVRA